MQAQRTTLSDADKSVDFTKVIQGHVSQSITQQFSVERTRTRSHGKLNIVAAEHIIKDQFGNLYVVFVSKLMDGDVYAVTFWVGIEKWNASGKKECILVREFKPWKQFDDAFLAALQDRAFVAFGNANVAILKARHAAKLFADRPVALATDQIASKATETANAIIASASEVKNTPKPQAEVVATC